jgi:twitching motility protein PilT
MRGMAAVDGLLGLVLAENADGIALQEGKVPELRKAGEAKPLSMPALRPELMRRFIEEVRSSGDPSRYVLEARGARTAFAVVIDEPHRLEFERSDGATRTADTGRSPVASEPSASMPVEPTPDAREVDVAEAGGVAARIVADAVATEATDVFLSTSADARVRVGGELREIAGSRLDEATLLAIAHLDADARARLDGHGSVDTALRVGGVRVRMNLFRHRGGLAAVLRPIRTIRLLAELALPSDLESLVALPDGLVLLVGPAGSGKSSTIAALLEHLNRTRSRHVVTIEDPIEFEYENRCCLIHQREVGRDVESFAAGLRAALREAPDVILVGEMRDPETFAAALTAAETGHLVLSTLHSGSAAMAIERIIDAFPAHQQSQVRGQLAGVLRSIVTQVLLPTIDGGLTPATERMVVTHAIAHKIRESRGHQIWDLIQSGRAEGMITLEASLADLARRGRITAATARAAARNQDLMRELLQT